MKKVAVLQSNYIPWRGYFDIIHDVELFIFYDEVQYTKNDWRNRNIIQTMQGGKWITLPCGYDLHRRIYEVKLKNELEWQKKHYEIMLKNYCTAPYFEKYHAFIKQIYLEMKWEYLYELNRYIIKTVSQEFLGVKTQFADSRFFQSDGSGHEKLLSLLKSAGATEYVSGPAAREYIVAEEYQRAGIHIKWKDYAGYPTYKQLQNVFQPNVCILDLLFNVGEQASYYIWGWRDKDV